MDAAAELRGEIAKQADDRRGNAASLRNWATRNIGATGVADAMGRADALDAEAARLDPPAAG